MYLNFLSPYIRVAMYSTLPEKCTISKRVIFDYEMIYVQSGECVIAVDGIEYLCTANKVVFLRPGITHSFAVPENTVFVQPHIHFDAIYRNESESIPISYKDLPQMTNDEKELIPEDIFSNINIPTVFEPENPSEFRKCFFRLINHYRDNGNDFIKLKAMMLDILYLVLKQFSYPQNEDAFVQDRRLEAVKEYIDANYTRGITLDEIAGYFSYNKYTLIRSFKCKFGVTLIAYYNKKRFIAACELLENTSLRVNEISDILSFGDEYTFSRFFKKRCGVSPLNYRNNGENS